MLRYLVIQMIEREMKPYNISIPSETRNKNESKKSLWNEENIPTRRNIRKR